MSAPETVRRSDRDQVVTDDILHRIEEIEENQERLERKFDRVLAYILEEKQR